VTLLSVEDLHAGYGETEVLRGISLSVDAGEVVSLVGRNGVGKTTTLRAIAGSVAPTAGTVTFRDEAITGLSSVEVARRGVMLVPEDRRAFPGLTTRENLEVARIAGDGRGWRVEDVLAEFESLRDRIDTRAASLSGGEQQMLAIARALVAGGDLLMLDEPTEGLAPTIVERVEDLVADLNEEGVTVLLVEQNVRTALELGDRAYVLDGGEIVFDGTAEELRSAQRLLDRHLGVSG